MCVCEWNVLMYVCTHRTLFLCKQLRFPSQPGVAKEICQNEAESCLEVAYVLSCFLLEIKEMAFLRDLRLGSCLAVA